MRIVCYFLVLVLTPYSGADAQREHIELLVVGDEYGSGELPTNPAGAWWVLHRSTGTPTLELLEVTVTPVPGCSDEPGDDPSGRVVAVPQARGPILMVRGTGQFEAGPVRTAFLDDDGTGERREIEVRWVDQRVLIRHQTEPPSGDKPGRYRIDLTIGERHFELHTDQWQGDGHWLLRWVGDLNRDGWPDVLLDASYKYSVYTSRLFLSRATDAEIEFVEAARFEHTGC